MTPKTLRNLKVKFIVSRRLPRSWSASGRQSRETGHLIVVRGARVFYPGLHIMLRAPPPPQVQCQTQHLCARATIRKWMNALHISEMGEHLPPSPRHRSSSPVCLDRKAWCTPRSLPVRAVNHVFSTPAETQQEALTPAGRPAGLRLQLQPRVQQEHFRSQIQ